MIILNILMGAKEPINSQQLADGSRSSVRTVKNDIHYLDSEMRKEDIACIESYKAKGYKIRPLDPQKYEAMHKHIRVLSSFFWTHSIEHTMRKIFIIQKLLANDYIKLEDLCERMYISRSTIKEDMNHASEFIESYHLRIVSVPGKGICIRGREQDIRSALVETACSQYHDFDAAYPVPEFMAMFYDERQQYEDVRHAFLKHMRESRISLKDITSKKCATHLCLIRSRVKAGKKPDIPDEMRKEIEQTYAYQLAGEIFTDETIHDFLGDVPEIEVLNFARLLTAKMDVELQSDRDQALLANDWVIENQKIFQGVQEKMTHELGASLLSMEMFRLYAVNIESLQMAVYLQHRFDRNDGQRIVTYNEDIENLVSPLAMEISRKYIVQLEKVFKEKICGTQSNAYALAIDHLLEPISYPYHKQRLAVTSNAGRITAELIRQKIEKYYGDYVQSVEVFELYEMRRINFADYDAVIITGDFLYQDYPVRFVSYRRGYDKNSRSYMFEQLFRYGYDSSFVQYIRSLVECFPDVDANSPDELIHTLTFKYGKDDAGQKELWRLYQQKKRILPYYNHSSGVAIVFFENRLCSHSFIDLFTFEQPAYAEENMEVKFLITVSMKEDMDPSSLRFLGNILYAIAMDADYAEGLMKDPDKTLMTLYNRIIREDFLYS